MIDESFFDERGEVRDDRLDEFVARLQASVAKGRRHLDLVVRRAHEIKEQGHA